MSLSGPYGVEFDGTNDHGLRTTPFVGSANGPLGCFRITFRTTKESRCTFYGSGIGNRVFIRLTGGATPRIEAYLKDAPGFTTSRFYSVAAYNDGVEHTAVIITNRATKTQSMWVDGAEIPITVTVNEAADVAWAESGNYAIGRPATVNAETMQGMLSDFAFWDDWAPDLSDQAEFDKLFRADGGPTDLGEDGTATGCPLPRAYFSVRNDRDGPSSFYENRTGQGDLTEFGALDWSDPQPAYYTPYEGPGDHNYQRVGIQDSGNNTTLPNYVPTAGAGGKLVVSFLGQASSLTRVPTSVTYAGQALALVAWEPQLGSDGFYLGKWYLDNPTAVAASGDVVVTLSGNTYQRSLVATTLLNAAPGAPLPADIASIKGSTGNLIKGEIDLSESQMLVLGAFGWRTSSTSRELLNPRQVEQSFGQAGTNNLSMQVKPETGADISQSAMTGQSVSRFNALLSAWRKAAEPTRPRGRITATARPVVSTAAQARPTTGTAARAAPVTSTQMTGIVED